jgi:hypothetical protein
MEASNHGLDLHGDTLGLSRCKIQSEPLYDLIPALHFCCQLFYSLVYFVKHMEERVEKNQNFHAHLYLVAAKKLYLSGFAACS